jgi:hypothetical protein
VHIGNVEAIPKEGMTMKKLTTKLMIAATVLVALAGTASAQIKATMNAQIPFEFRVGNHIMAPGTYQVDKLDTGIFRLSDVHLLRSIVVLPQARVDPRMGSAVGRPNLLFACTGGSCVLAQLWSGTESYAYAFSRPKLDKDEEASLRVIPLQRNKGE